MSARDQRRVSTLVISLLRLRAALRDAEIPQIRCHPGEVCSRLSRLLYCQLSSSPITSPKISPPINPQIGAKNSRSTSLRLCPSTRLQLNEVRLRISQKMNQATIREPNM